jgi:hypothetical protein
MIGYDRRPAEAMKKNKNESFSAPSWIFHVILFLFAVKIIAGCA